MDKGKIGFREEATITTMSLLLRSYIEDFRLRSGLDVRKASYVP